jgi:hypothetical protein
VRESALVLTDPLPQTGAGRSLPIGGDEAHCRKTWRTKYQQITDCPEDPVQGRTLRQILFW